MLRASLRAGITSETIGASAGGAARSSSSEREPRARTRVTTGPRIQGAARSTGVSEGTLAKLDAGATRGVPRDAPRRRLGQRDAPPPPEPPEPRLPEPP